MNEKIYVLECRFMNGSVTIENGLAAFTDIGIAKKAEEAVKKANSDNAWLKVLTNISEIPIYHTENEVPILKQVK